MKFLLYHTIKIIIRVGLFFYTKQIKVVGKENIPKKGAILFTANHPNGLIDPLIIATQVKRKLHFLVRANVFKKDIVATFFGWMGMMPIYRIRDGFNQLHKNDAIFTQCEELLQNQNTLLIFPEGSHANVRYIRTISKGFTRIIFGALAKYSNLKIHIIPVGITYQNPSYYPSKVALHFGKPILANDFYIKEEIHTSTRNLKSVVFEKLQELTTNIKNDVNYNSTLQQLREAQIDFTDVQKTNSIVNTANIPAPKKLKYNYLKPLKYLIILNSCVPYFIWKKIAIKIDEIEFIDTFRFGLNLILFSTFYTLQTLIVTYFFNWKIGVIYLVSSLVFVLIYSKFSITSNRT